MKNVTLNGHRAGDGAGAMLPDLRPLLDVARVGPVSPLPRQDPGQPDPAPPAVPEPAVRRGRMDGDTAIRLLTAGVVLAVAAFAAVVSYSHIFALAHGHGQDGTAARLLPLSIDGLIAAASLVMLHAGRNGLPVPRLSRAMLATGVTATVAANVLYAVPAQWIGPAWSALVGAAISAFPAVAFIGAVEMMIRFVSDSRAVAVAATAERPVPGGDSDSDQEPGDKDERQDERQDGGANPPAAGAGSARVRDILKRRPKLRAALLGDDADKRAAAKKTAAAAAGVSERTVERVVRELAARGSSS